MHDQIFRTHEYVKIKWQSRSTVADIIKFANWPWNGEIIVDQLGSPSVTPRVIQVKTKGRKERLREMRNDSMTRTWLCAGFGDGDRGHEPKNAGSLWKMKRARTRFFHRASRKKNNSSANNLILDQWDSFQTHDLQNCKIISLCFFKPVRVWHLITVVIENECNLLTLPCIMFLYVTI